RIIELKKIRLAKSKQETPLAEMRARATDVRSKSQTHRLLAALSKDGVNIIAEIKRASPSKGLIRGDIDAATVARAYEAGGAAAISILTEEDHFQGSLDDLRVVRHAVNLPLLRKDFIFDEYQVYESAAAGADALLLITAALDDGTLARLRRITEDELGMNALVEVHSADEMKRAVKFGARIIGVNNRGLRTFTVSLETSVQLAPIAPNEIALISESGIESAEDIHRLRMLGYRGFLIGESLMRADDPEIALRGFTQRREGAEEVGVNEWSE
ncbi:MAG TPA: indole-3-glycerol phosphate synthase TrpC, partial [Pyrinomonadaceae bacterium]|nr:indole-3-glycerol phosphate synthase TrpC [Pyrinomonadaceae bacterium]